MKTDKQQAATTTSLSSSVILPATTIANSTTLIKTECLGSRIAPGAVVPEETNQQGLTNDEIESRTKIMMRFMDDLTNIYFSTRNSIRLSVENGEERKFLQNLRASFWMFRWIMEWR